MLAIFNKDSPPPPRFKKVLYLLQSIHLSYIVVIKGDCPGEMTVGEMSGRGGGGGSKTSVNKSIILFLFITYRLQLYRTSPMTT